MKKLRFFVSASLVVGAALVSSQCSDSSNSTITDLSALLPGIGVGSPTATSSARGVRSGRATSEVKTASAYKSEVSTILAKTTAADCVSGLQFTTFLDNVSCYGPQLVVVNHPGGAVSGTCPSGISGQDGCLPSGDVGIWSATETSGEACAAAKLNALFGDVSESVASGMKFMAGMICVAQVSGKSIPTTGSSVDVSTEVQSAMSGTTISTAKIERLADYTGTSEPVYQVTLAGTKDSEAFSLILKHSGSSKTAFKGRFYGYFSAGASSRKGFSITYEQTSSTDLRYLARLATTPTSAGTSLFDTDGNYQYTTFTGTAGTSNARYLLANIDPTTGLGSVRFAWQAGGADNKTRVFHASVSRSGGTDSGFAYFGYGSKITNVNVTNIGGMCCNWAGPGGTCSADEISYDSASMAQSQTFSRTSTTAVFTPTASNLTYAPTNSCIHTPATTFKYGTATQWGTNGSGLAAASVAATQFTSLTAVGTMPSLTTPAFTP